MKRMTWEEIEDAAAQGGRCLVNYGKTESDSEAATILKFEFCMKAMTRKVLVRFDDDVEFDYFMRDIYHLEVRS